MVTAHSTITQEGQTLPGGRPGKAAAARGPWPAVAAVAASREATCSAGGIPAPYGFSRPWPSACLVAPWPVPACSGRPASAPATHLLSVPALEVRQLPLPLTLQPFLSLPVIAWPLSGSSTDPPFSAHPASLGAPSACPQVWLRPPGAVSSPRPIDFPLSPVPTDGLVKRLEELERTAELYKGGQCTSGQQPCGGRGFPTPGSTGAGSARGWSFRGPSKNGGSGSRNAKLQTSRTVAIKNSFKKS